MNSAIPEAHRAAFEEGMRLFNAGRHWHAHEAWEHVWLELTGDDKRFLQGLIMAAAMLVQYGKGVRRGVTSHHANVHERVPESGRPWGVDVAKLRADLAPFAQDAEVGRPMVRPTNAVQIAYSS